MIQCSKYKIKGQWKAEYEEMKSEQGTRYNLPYSVQGAILKQRSPGLLSDGNFEIIETNMYNGKCQ